MRRRLSDLDPYLSPPWREQFSPAEEERQARYEREQELNEEFAWLEELEPDFDDPIGEAA